MLKRLLLFSLALVLSLGPLALVGCGGLSAEEQAEIDRIVADALAADYDTVEFANESMMNLETMGGSDPSVMTVVAGSSGVEDAASEAIHLTMVVTMAVVGEGEEDISVEIYIADGWIYNLMDIAGLGGDWLKADLGGESWEQQSPVDQQKEILRTALGIRLLESETVDGVHCYVLEIEPDETAFATLLAQETSGMGFMDFGDLDVADLCEEVSVRQWLAQDSGRLVRVEVEMAMEMKPGDVGADSDAFDKMTVDLVTEASFSNYDQPVSIVVPDEALEADEVTY